MLKYQEFLLVNRYISRSLIWMFEPVCLLVFSWYNPPPPPNNIIIISTWDHSTSIIWHPKLALLWGSRVFVLCLCKVPAALQIVCGAMWLWIGDMIQHYGSPSGSATEAILSCNRQRWYVTPWQAWYDSAHLREKERGKETVRHEQKRQGKV